MAVIRGENVNRAGAAAAVKKQDRDAAKKQAFYDRRLKLSRHLAEKVNAGTMTPGQAHAKLQQAGFIPGGAAAKEAKGVGGFIARTIADVATNAVYAPAGIYQAGKAGALDARDAAQGHPTLKRSAGIGKAVVQGVKEDFKHPLRHPGNVGLDLFGIVSAGAGTAARGIAAAGAVGAEGSALAKAGAIGKALATKPKPLPRTIRLNGLEVHPVASTNPVMRGAQAIHDRALSSGKRLPGVPRGTREKRVGFELKQEGRILDPVANAEAAALHRAGSKGRTFDTANWRAQQRALKVAAQGRTTDATIAFHKGRIAALGNTPKALMEKRRHGEHIKDLKAAKAHLDETTGKPVVKTGPLADLYARTKAGAKNRDELLKRVGALTEDQIQGRVDAPGRLIAGAKYEKPTPGKLGTPSQVLLKARGRVTRLEALHERAIAKASTKAVPYGNVHTRTGLVKQDLKTAPEAALKRQHVEVPAGPKTPGVKSDLPAKGINTPTVERLGGALSVARDELARLEAAAANRVKPTGIVGAEDVAGGEFRVPSVSKKPPKSSGSGAGSGATVPFPKAPGSVTHGYTGSLLTHARERGDTARLVAESMMEANNYGKVLRVRDRIVKASVATPPNTDHYLPVRLDELKSGKLPQIVKDLGDLPEGAARNALEASQHGTRMQQFWDQVFPPHKTLTTEAKAEFDKLAEQGKIGWIHKDVLRQVRTPSLLAPVRAHIAEGGLPLRIAAGVVPAINRASKQAILYLKPAYAVPNMLGNAALALVQQGFAMPLNLKRSSYLNAKIGDRAAAAMDAAIGEGFTAALHDQGHGIGAKITNVSANAWGKAVDLPFRRAAFIHEARRFGYKTTDQLQALLTDQKHADDLVQVGRRANDALIDYGRLGPLEKEIVKHVVFFYPWVKGSTMYAGHFVAEHPAQAALSNELGQIGHDQATQDLGQGPSYTQGMFKVGGTQERPLTVNPNGAAILTTPAQVAQTALAPFQEHPTKATSLLSNLTPALGAALAAFGTRRDALTDRPLTGKPVHNFFDQLTGHLPQKVLYDRLRDTGALKRFGIEPSAKGADQSGKLFPMDAKTAALQFGLGSAAPKPMNEEKFLSLGEKEHRDTLDRVAKVRYDAAKDAKAYEDAARAAKLLPANGKLPSELGQALKLRTLREANLAIHQDKLGRKMTGKDRFLADVDQLVGWKRVTPKQAAEARAWAEKASDTELTTQRGRIGEAFYKAHVLSYARKQIRLHDPHAKLP